uniref:Uncharacterized protein n=1 Tax=Leishmania guyanensis TaxID=5670 RepID=A0A1E1IWH9_LEIGU|nr:hypothetical protein, conserved [Leishmania guyanensis]
MQHSHATSMARNTTTTATTALTHSASTASSDTLFRLECVLLFALDVVRGPYIHSSAPANPPEAIRSFLHSQAAPDSSSPAAAAYSAVAASSLAAGSSTVRCGAPPLQQQQPLCLRKVSPETIGSDIATAFPAGSPTDAPTALPNTKWASSAILASRSFGASSIGTSDCVLATGSFSSLYVPTPPSPPQLAAAVDAPPSSEPSTLQRSARVPLLSQPPLPAKSLVNHADATSGLPISILGNMPSSSMRSVASSNMAPRCLVGLSDPPTSDVARAYVVGASGTERAASEDIAVFGVSPQTCKSDSHRTLPSLSATMGLCAFGASRSAGGGDGLALCANSVEHVGESAHASDGHCRDTRSEAPRALGGKTGIGSGTPLTGKPAAARSAPLPPTNATVSGTAADSDRMSGYNDVFVPRSEFCRRVLWLYPAESGLLFLYYPEDIPGEHYQRKTLRYSLCLVFRVDHKRMTIGDGLLHQRVHPYSVVLTNIAEELREAELKYAYMSRGLRSFNSASRQLSSLALISPIYSLPAPATAAFHAAAPPPVTSSITTTPATEGSEDVEEDVGQAHVATALALPSGAAPKPYALPCSRTTGQSGTVATAVSAAAAVGGTVRRQPPAEMADRTPALRMPPQQSATPSLGEGTEGRRSAEGVTPTASGGCNWQQCKGGAGDAQGCHNGEDGSLPPGVRGSAASSPRVITNTAASTMANSPSPGLGTPLSTPMGTHSCSSGGLTGAIAVDTASAGADGVAGDGGVRASSSYVISMEMINMATAPPSLLPVCSRTMGEAAAAADHPSPAQLEALGGWVGTPVSHSAAFSSPSATTAPASAFSADLGGTRQQMLPLHSTVGANPITSPRLPFPHHGLTPTAAVAGADDSTTAVPNMHILNAFITPPTAPQWTPLNELVAEIFHCLSYTSEAPDGTGNCEQDGPIGSPAAGGRTPLTVSPTSAGATIGLAAQEPKGALGAEISNKAWTQRPNPTTSASPTGQQQQQRGDTSVVHLSSRLSFHVRRMAPLQSARLLHLDHVPVPVVAYDPAMMEWMDMAVHNVFRLVDGVRTVADLVFSVAMGTTTTLAEVCAEALQRSAMERQAAQMMAPTTSLPGSSACTAQRSATTSGDRVRSAAGSPNQPIVVSVPIDTRLCSSLLPGVRYSIQTSAAAVTISDGQVPLPSHVNVRVTPGAASGPGTLGASASVSSGTSDSATAAPIASEEPGSNSVATTAAASSSQSLHIAVELPQTWVATTGIVMEALLHLELCHLIKVYLPWTEETLYSITNSAQRALYSACHPVRHVLAHYLLCVAWAERQERRKEQHRVIVERNPVQKESIIEQREARLASTSLRIIPPALPEKQHASAPLGVVPPQQRSSATGAVASPPVPPSSTARATAPEVTSVSGVGSAVTAIAVRSPDRLIDSSAWSPAASPRMSSSVPCASGTSHIGLHQQRPHQPRSLAPAGYVGSPSVVNAPRADTVSINVGGGGATHTRGLDQYSADTYASSPVSTSFAPSSLRHELSVGASGRLQLTLMNSLSTFSPRRSDFGGGAARSGTSPRLFLGNQGNQTSSGLLPCSATGVSQQQRQQQRWKQYPHKQACLGAAASFHSCSSTSKDSCASGSCRSSSSASPSVCNDGDSSSVPSSSSSSSSCATSMPMSVSNMQQLVALSVAGVSAAPTSAVLEGIEVPVLSSLTASAAESSVLAQASKDAIIVDTVVDPVQHPLDPPSDYGAGIELPTAELTAASALRTAERHAKRTSTAEALQRENRRHHSPSVKVFAPTEADVSHAAAAALCALAKFNNASVLSVQKEMRRMPVWATSFNYWSDRCVKALVEVALLNNWLEDVSR